MLVLHHISVVARRPGCYNGVKEIGAIRGPIGVSRCQQPCGDGDDDNEQDRARGADVQEYVFDLVMCHCGWASASDTTLTLDRLSASAAWVFRAFTSSGVSGRH